MTTTAQLTLRPANSSDCRFVWETNNHPTVRKEAINTESIPWDSHRSWFAKIFNDPLRELLLITRGDDRLGVIRFDIDEENERAVFTIALSPDCRGEGIGRVVIRRASRFILQRDDVEAVLAYIRPDNTPSQRAFKSGGFVHRAQERIEGVLLERFEYQGDESDR